MDRLFEMKICHYDTVLLINDKLDSIRSFSALFRCKQTHSSIYGIIVLFLVDIRESAHHLYDIWSKQGIFQRRSSTFDTDQRRTSRM